MTHEQTGSPTRTFTTLHEPWGRPAGYPTLGPLVGPLVGPL
jgi:hypothetical protein